MLKYNPDLKDKARQLRRNLIDSEASLWSRLRNKQLLGIQFYRQKPIGEHVVDFFAPRAKLVVEVDGSQRLGGEHALKDRNRDGYLASLGLKVLRFDSREVLKESDAVVEVIYRTLAERLNAEIFPSPTLANKSPLRPPLAKGGRGDFDEAGITGIESYCAVRKTGDSPSRTAQSGGEPEEGRRSVPLGRVRGEG